MSKLKKLTMAQMIKSNHPRPDEIYCNHIMDGLMGLSWIELKQLYDECEPELDEVLK